jgi:hypothetical protein
MATAQISFLVIGLALQICLLLLLFRRRMASQVVLLTTLLFFYIVRSSLLFGLSHHISRTAIETLFSWLSLLDIMLQIALAVELSLAILRSGSKSLLRRSLLIPLCFLLAGALTTALTAVLPAQSPVPADRGILFTGFLFLLLLAGSTSVRLTLWRRSVLIGFAAIGGSGILSQSAKAIAASHHDAHLFSLWSYGSAGVYLIVLLFWMLCCKTVRTTPTLSNRTPAMKECLINELGILRRTRRRLSFRW